MNTLAGLPLFEGFQPRPAPRLVPPPRLPAGTLRPYQEEAVAAILASLGRFRSTLAVMATGTGKTETAAFVVKRWPGRVLWLAHRDELIAQARERLERITAEPVATEKASDYASRDARLVVGSVQTVASPTRMADMGDFGLIVVDEAHHAPATTYRRIIDHFATAKVLGLTATPDRADEKALGKVFEDVAYVMDLGNAIGEGWLVPIQARMVEVERLDISAVGKVGKDLAVGALDEAMLDAVRGVVSHTLRLEPTLQAIAFWPGVKSAELACDVFNKEDPGSTCFISGETEEGLRRRLVADFRAGRVKRLMNCAIAVEGFDAPNAALIVMARPTLSRGLFAQMVGRGSRPHAGVVDGPATAEERRTAIASSDKPCCKILDFVGNAGKHSLVSAVDLLGGDYSDDEVALAKKREKKAAGPVDPAMLLAEARADIQRAAERAAAMVARSATVRDVDMFRMLGVQASSVSYLDRRFGYKPMSEKQHDMLLNAGFKQEQLAEVGSRGASSMISKLVERRTRGLATLKQLAVVRKHVQVPDTLTFDKAREMMDYVASTGWRPNAAELNRILGRTREPGEEG